MEAKAKCGPTDRDFRVSFRYCKRSGNLYWRVRRGPAHPGDVAGCVMGDGYVYTKLKGRKMLVHRIAWFLVTGRWPNGEIDHKNGSRTDNRWRNLRDVSSAGNKQNTTCRGYAFIRRTGKFRAQIKFGGKRMALGEFLRESDARRAYVEAKRKHHPYATRRTLEANP